MSLSLHQKNKWKCWEGGAQKKKDMNRKEKKTSRETDTK